MISSLKFESNFVILIIMTFSIILDVYVFTEQI